jgi:hypothetical protein
MAEKREGETISGAAGARMAGQGTEGGAPLGMSASGGTRPGDSARRDDSWHEASRSAREGAREAVHGARDFGGQIMGEVRQAAESLFEEQKGRAAETVHGVADALRHTARDMHERSEPIARYAEQAADQVERFSDAVRERRIGDIVGDLDDIARRQPTLFLLGAVAAGFITGRFMAASAERRRHEAHRYPHAEPSYGGAERYAGYGAERGPYGTRGTA